MKLSKSLLQAIALGVTLGAATTSCSLFDDGDAKPDLHSKDCTANCDIDHSKSAQEHTYDNCPACGMG